MGLFTGRFREMREFYMKVLGMRVSGEYFAGSSDNLIASFLHCGLAQEFVDHHTVVQTEWKPASG